MSQTHGLLIDTIEFGGILRQAENLLRLDFQAVLGYVRDLDFQPLVGG